jgi:NAD(P)-dependent dehydrogenase (short-subunit alcohol dehydrogenase family)
MLLADRVVLLTGAKRIGATIATTVAARGADVALSYNRSSAEADDTAAAIRKLGRRAITVQADLSDSASCHAMVERVGQELGRLDVLINMASLYNPTAFEKLDVAAWDKQLDVDLRASYLCSLAAVPLMREHGGGRIVNFSDWLAMSGRPRYKGYLTYYVAKAGVKALTEALALEVAGDRILVNAIAPGPILAPPGTSEDEHEAVEKSTPLGRWGGADEITKAVLAFIESDFVTGETIRVDGGRHLY